MKLRQTLALMLLMLGILGPYEVTAGIAGTALRDAAEAIFKKFGRGAAGETVEQIGDALGKATARYGDAAIPLLRNSGHAGFKALETAGEKAPDVIKLYTRKGDEALWVISEPKRLAIFIKHGDSAADALMKYPGIADDLIERFGSNAVGAVSSLTRQNAQHLAIAAEEGLLKASAKSPELLPVIRQYGDQAMDFIWKNKGALTVAAVLGTFLADPQAYISGAKDLFAPVMSGTNWTLIIVGILVIAFLPFIARTILRTRKAIKAEQTR